MFKSVYKFFIFWLYLAAKTESLPKFGLCSGCEIIGGNETNIQNFPFQVSIQFLGLHNCGGSIISEDVILTAGHCIDGIISQFYEVVAGTSDLRNASIRVKAKESFAHENYSGYDYDIGIIRLAEKLKFSEFIQPAVLPEDDYVIAVDTALNVSGFGVVDPGDIFSSSELRYVEVNLIDHDECAKDYEEYNVTERMICAGVLGGGKDACQGDSGGPVSTNGTVVGIVSWGMGCALPEYPGVYTSVSSLRSWIRDKTGI